MKRTILEEKLKEKGDELVNRATQRLKTSMSTSSGPTPSPEKPKKRSYSSDMSTLSSIDS
jgi:hypothetical protein